MHKLSNASHADCICGKNVDIQLNKPTMRENKRQAIQLQKHIDPLCRSITPGSLLRDGLLVLGKNFTSICRP